MIRTKSIRYSDVKFGYNKKANVLHGINLELHAGQIISILGPNGSGKTTLLQLTNGLLQPTSGKIELNGLNIQKFKTSQLARNISITFQFARLHFYCNTVEEEIQVSTEFSTRNPLNKKEEVQKILDLFSLCHLRSRHPYSLSGGEQRRLSLAISYASNADFFFFDEPTANIDRPSRLLLNRLFKNLKNMGKGVVVVSHDVEFQLNLCDNILILDRGKIKYFDSPFDFIASREYLKHDFIRVPEIFLFLQELKAEKSDLKVIQNYITLPSLSEKVNFLIDTLEGISE